MSPSKKATVVVLSDIHANIQALSAVLDHIRQSADPSPIFVIGGDAVGIGPDPERCLEMLMSLQNCSFILGNSDRYVVMKTFERSQAFHKDMYQTVPTGYRENLQWTFSLLSQEQIAFIRIWNPNVTFKLEISDVCVTHGIPGNDEICLNTAFPEQTLKTFTDYDYYVSGHCHIPMIRRLENRWFINAGSVGDPLDGDTRACYLTLTACSRGLFPVIHRVEYDLDATLARLRERDVPWKEAIIPVFERASL